MPFRSVFKKNLTQFASQLPAQWLMNRVGQPLILPFYHLISDVPVAHVKELYRVKTIAEFEEDLEFLLTHYRPIDIPELLKISQSGIVPKHPVCLLSFDDGLREFYDYIAPILLKKGVPAVCFLNTAFIDNRDLFFRYKASLLIGCFKKNPALQKMEAVQMWQQQLSNNNISEQLLDIKYHNQDKLDHLATVIGFDFKSYLQTQQPYMTGAQILELSEQGFYFGGHSVDHPEYQYIDLSNQLKQTCESVGQVMEKYKMSHGLFSFPFTDHKVSSEFFDKIKNESQIELTFGTAGLKNEKIPFHFQRIPFEAGNLSAHEILNVELLYYLLKRPLGKNTIDR